MLNAIKIESFKSYRSQVLHLSPLTLMIGANASGKSNALEAFRFLCWLSQGQKLSVLKHNIDDSEQILRGQVSGLGYIGQNSFVVGAHTSFDEWDRFEVEVSLRDSELHISQESVFSSKDGVPLYRVVEPSVGYSNDLRVAYNNFAKGGKKPQLNCTDQIAVLSQLASSAMFERGHKKAQKVIPKVTDKLQTLLENTLFLDPVPSLMRGDSYPAKYLRSDCSNLSGVLYELCGKDIPWEKNSAKEKVIELICSLPEQNIKDINFYEDRKGQVELELVESFGKKDRSWSTELLSDGTLRVLAIATALLSAPEGATVVIEEVDNGVHPSRAKQLLETMRALAESRDVRLLLSTHNPALMDALPDSALGDVVFCYRDPEHGDSQLTRLSDLNDYPGLVSQGPLGELVTNGIVDRFVKSPITPEQKKNNALEWLEKMQGTAS